MAMYEPTECILWTEPNKILRGASNLFTQIECFMQESHFSKRLLRCRECGQHYLVEFHEDIDWVDGDDPQVWIYTPVADANECMQLLRGELDRESARRPRLHRDWPKGEDMKAYWVKD